MMQTFFRSNFLLLTILIAVLLAFLSFPLFFLSSAHAQTVTVGVNCRIQWNANVEADLAKYTVTATLTSAAGIPVTKVVDVPKPPVVVGVPPATIVSTTCAALGFTTGGALTGTVEAVDTLGNRSIKSLVALATQDVAAPSQPSGVTWTANP